MACRAFGSTLRASMLGLLAVSGFGAALSVQAQTTPVSVLTQRNNNLRTGINASESILNTTNVNPATFGRVFTRQAHGPVCAQPLYVPNLTINGVATNVVYVATMSGYVHAFDADKPLAPTLWTANLAPNNTATYGNDGILATPVIDPATQTLYVVCRTTEGNPALPSSWVIRLHALDLITGNEKAGSPVKINFTVRGNGTGSVRGAITFNGAIYASKPALLLTKGKVLLGLCSGGVGGTPGGDNYHGFVLAYDAATLKQTAVWCSTPNGFKGGVWACGNGLMSDDKGNVWVAIADGTTDLSTNNYGMATVRLALSDTALTPVDYFIPYDYVQLTANDSDLGVSGPVAVPGSKYLLQGSKQGYLYVLDPFNLGHFEVKGDTNIPQRLFASNGEMHGDPACYVGPDGTTTIFYMSEEDYIYGFKVLPTGTLDLNSSIRNDNIALPEGGFMAVSCLGTQAGTGILWCNRIGSQPTTSYKAGLLEAYDPTTLKLLWSSNQTPNRDMVGGWGKWLYPTVANGKVYMGSGTGDFVVYGLLPAGVPATPTGLSAVLNSSGSIVLSWPAVPGAVGYNVRSGAFQGGPYALRVLNTSHTSTQPGFDRSAGNANRINYYVVSAVNSNGESLNSAELAFSPWPVPPVISESNASGTPTISWPAATSALSYTVLRGTVKGGPYGTVLAQGITTLSYADSSALPNTKYYYVVTSINNYGTSGNSNEVSN